MEIFFIIIVVGIYLSIFIFGYTKDYKRNPREFVRTIIGMPIAMISNIFGLNFLDEKIKKWTEKDKKK